jgi:hypothetical protein
LGGAWGPLWGTRGPLWGLGAGGSGGAKVDFCKRSNSLWLNGTDLSEK